jgi:glutamine---fructose-6-phosphate transaminase (isomerizing)
VSWAPDPVAFLADLEAKPAALRALAARLATDPWAGVDLPRRVVFLGMGSSRFAALAATARLRGLGVDAVAEFASAATLPPSGPGTLAVGVSASGESAETVEALARFADAGADIVAITEAPGSPLAGLARTVIELGAGQETGGVACRTYQHTLAALLGLERLLGGDVDPPHVIRRAADATEDLLARRDEWLPETVRLLTATGRAFILAPVERLANAEQGALMLREGPRLDASVCETGDWLHVDVYLTKTLDYRALLFAGSRFDAAAMTWLRDREATVVAVGGDRDGARRAIRYAGDDDPAVALLTEVLVAELVAASVWAAT